MANYYSLASFIVPSNPEEAEALVGAIHQFREWFDEVPEWITDPIKDTDSLSIKIIKQAYDADPSCFESGMCDGEVVDDETHGCTWLYSDDSINDLGVATVICAYLELTGRDDIVIFEVALTCGRPRLDAFGGFAIACTKEGYRYHGSTLFTTAELKANRDKRKYWFVEQTQSPAYLVDAPNTTRAADITDSDTTITEIEPHDFSVMKQYLKTNTLN